MKKLKGLALGLAIFASTSAVGNAEEIVVTVTSMENSVNMFDDSNNCSLEFSITNNAYGTIHKIRAKLTGWDDRGEKLGELLSATADNTRGLSHQTIAKGATVVNVGDATFEVNCKYLAVLKYDGIDEDDCAMRMLPENVSCSEITTLRSNIPSIKIKE